MSSTTRDPFQRRRRAGRLALVIALTFGLLAALAPPASAAGGIDVPPPPGSGYGDGRTSTGTTICQYIDWWPGGGIGVRPGTKIVVYAVYPSCRQYQGWEWVNNGLECTSAYDVWRFYGTVEKPAEAWSVSRADQYSACANPAAKVVLNIPHADDAMVSWYPHAGSPFRWDNGYGFSGQSISSGRPVSLTGNGAEWLTSPNTPFRAGGRSCVEFSTPESVLGRYFMNLYGGKGADYDTPMGAAVRKEFKQTWMRVAAQWGTQWANTMINSRTVSARDPWNNGATYDWTYGVFAGFNSDPNGDFIVYGDGQPCSSDLDFFTEVPPGATATPAQQKVMGACWMPIRRTEQGFRHRVTGEMWWTDSFKYPQVYAYRFPAKRNNELEKLYAWVASMEAWTRPPEVNPDHAPPGGVRMRTPANPWTGTWDGIPDLVRDNAQCGTVYGALWKASESKVDDDKFVTSVTADVTVPIGQVGGALRPAALTANLVLPGDGSVLVANNMTVSVTAPSGFPASGWSQSGWTGSGSRTNTLKFFRSTDPGKPFTVTVGGTVTLKKMVKSTTALMRPCGVMSGNISGFTDGAGGSMGSQCSMGSSEVEVEVRRTVPVVGSYTVGGKPSPNGQFPVISATEVPKPGR
jgi:hypothetical protein